MKERFAIAAVLVAMCLVGEAQADEPVVKAPIPGDVMPSTVAPSDLKPGDVLTVTPDSSLSKIDMTNFYVLSIEWQPANPGSVQYGLRADGTVVWRKAK